MKKAVVTIFLCIPVIVSGIFLRKDSSISAKEPQLFVQKVSPGEKIFKKYCISCHQADGGGVPNLNPPLIKTPYVLGDKKKLIKIILHGLNENIEIKGEFFSNPMPELSILKDQEIADVLTYVRSSFGNKASAVTAAEVKAARSEPK